MTKFFRFKPDESDLFLCLGVESLFFGSFLIYPPAAYLIAGVIFTALAVVVAR